MSFYPQGYEPKQDQGDYMKITEGEHRIRIMSNPAIGYQTFYKNEEGKNKVLRSKTFKELVNDRRASDGIREFHAFIVWNYAEESLMVLNVTQKKIQRAIFELANDEDWGDPKQYDILIKRTGTGFNDTEYSVIAKPAKPAPQEATDAMKEVTIDFDLYFSGGDPIVRGEGATVEDAQEVFESAEVADEIPF